MGSVRNSTPTDFADGVTLRAVLADKYQTSPFGCRLLCEGEFSYTQQNCAPGKKWPLGLAPYHSSLLPLQQIIRLVSVPGEPLHIEGMLTGGWWQMRVGEPWQPVTDKRMIGRSGLQAIQRCVRPNF